MTDDHNTLLLRFAGPMQSWGTGSRLQLRRTDAQPSKSGVLGLLLCALGIRREDSAAKLPPLVALRMGVRTDRAGTLDWDYHTAGAGVGIRTAEGKLKLTATTGEYETLLSRRQYLCDASFLVALHGDPATVNACSNALDDPVWPVFLGRKSCVPSEPVLAGTGTFDDLTGALASVPWYGRPGEGRGRTRTLAVHLEHPAGAPPPHDARLVFDVPRVFGAYGYGPRWVVPGEVRADVAGAFDERRSRRDPYGQDWPGLRAERLRVDNGLCVFCKSPAVEVHHTDYADVRLGTLRSLCRICHDACTIIEYGRGRGPQRTDPADPAMRDAILSQIHLLLRERRPRRRLELRESVRTLGSFRSGE